MDEQEQKHQEGQDHPEGATGATGATGPTGATVGKEVTDQLPESERNYSGNLGNDVVGGPGFQGGGVPRSTSQRDASGQGAVSDIGSAAGAPVPQAKHFDRQGATGMGASGSSADVEQEEFQRTHNEDGSLTDEEQAKVDEQTKRNEETAAQEQDKLK